MLRTVLSSRSCSGLVLFGRGFGLESASAGRFLGLLRRAGFWGSASVWGLVAWVLLFSPSVSAQVVRDGSIGPAAPGLVTTDSSPLGGTAYLIGEADGALIGGRNLFHSFEVFDLGATDEAVYQGSPSIENLITRVTGGPSTIDGLLRSEIAGANLYFINPAGVLFGPSARIDIPGAFVVTTAERLLFEGGEIFDVRDDVNPILSVADVEGLGFLSSPAPISIQGSRLEGGTEESVSLVGGDLEIRGDTSNGRAARLAVQGGRIDLVSLGSSGEVYLDVDEDGDGEGDGGLRVENVSVRGDIVVADNATVTTNGIGANLLSAATVVPVGGAGPLNVIAQNLLLEDADFQAITVRSQDAGDINIDLDGDLVLRVASSDRAAGILSRAGFVIEPGPDDVVMGTFFNVLTDGTLISGEICQGIGACGIRFDATGNAAGISIRAKSLAVEGGAQISATSFSRGDAGAIELDISDEISVTGLDALGNRSSISSNALGAGAPGIIEVNSPTADLILEDFGAIVIESQGAGSAGNPPGRVEIDVARLQMSGNARIDTSTRGDGDGGSIDIRASESVSLSGRLNAIEFSGITSLSQPGSTGDAGDIRIETPVLDLSDGAEIAAQPVGMGGLGAAGNLSFEIASSATLRSSQISTESDLEAGGNIDFFVGEVLDLGNSEITTSVTDGAESGGNITITSGPQSAIILDQSVIRAEASEGTGGDILIESGLFLEDPDSLVSARATSKIGFDGRVVGDSPDAQLIDLNQDLETPSIDVSTLLDEPCAARRPEGANSLLVKTPSGFPLHADGFSPVFLPRDFLEGILGGQGADVGGDSDASDASDTTEAFIGSVADQAPWRSENACGG